MAYGTSANIYYTLRVNGGDVFDHLARGINLGVALDEKSKSNTGDKGQFSAIDTALFRRTFSRTGTDVLSPYADYSLGLWESISAHMGLVSAVSFYSPVPDRTAESPNKFIEDMKLAAYELWWPSLQTLRATDESCDPEKGNSCGGLIDLWLEFGIALGLGTDEERAVHDGSKQRSTSAARAIEQLPSGRESSAVD